jgi:predicted transcriptional regulator
MGYVFKNYRPNNSSFQKLMLSDGVRDVVEKEAHRMAAYLAGIAPKDSGQYATSFKVTTGVDAHPRPPESGPRAAAFLINDAPHAKFLEYGSRTVKDPPRLLTRLAAQMSHPSKKKRGR